MAEPWVRAQVAEFCARHGGTKVRPLGAAVPLRIDSLRQARDSVPTILRAQRRILQHLLDTLGPAGVLDLFGVPADLAPWIAVLTDPEADCQPILRADLLPARDGTTWICEINVDSALGGAETAEFHRIEEVAAGRTPEPTPYEHLATLLGPILAGIGGRKICLLDWSTWSGFGLFDLDWMRQTLAARLPGVTVFCATEKDRLAGVDERTVVYRMFMAEDALTDLDFVRMLFTRAGHVLTDFSGELLGSKMWLALLHDPVYRQLLDDSMVRAVVSTVPPTVRVTAANLDQLLADRSGLFFKSACDFGGRGVVCGRNATEVEIRTVIGRPDAGRWIAQRAVDVAELEIWPPGTAEPATARCVLGWFRFGTQWSGVPVRSQVGSEVINATGGASIGWGYEVDG